MNLTPARRVRLAVVLFALTGLGIGRLACTSFARTWRSAGTGATERFVARYEPLRPYISPQQSVGYLPDTAHLDLALLPVMGRLSLAQYTLSPPVVDLSIEHPLVIFESDDPQAVPKVATAAGWTLVADFRNGVKLFRTARP